MSRAEPAPGPRRRIPAGQRRLLIAAQAAEVFAERGYDGASMDEIAGRSGISAPVLYDHFPSKLALYQQVLESEYEHLRDSWQRNIAGPGPMRDRVAAAIDGWFAHVEQRRASVPLLFHIATADPGARQAQTDTAVASRALLLPLVHEVLIEKRQDDDTEAQLLLEVVAAALRALALWWHSHPTTPRATLTDAALQALWPGMEQRIRTR